MNSLGRLLIDSSAFGKEKIAELNDLLAQGADINAVNTRGQTCLHSAAAHWSGETLLVLLAAGADIHAKDFEGRNVLHEVAISGASHAALALVHAGADVNAKDGSGRTALHWAAIMDRTTMVSALIGGGADINLTDEFGFTPLDRAASRDKRKTFLALITYGAVRSQPGKILCDFNFSKITMRQAAVEGGFLDRLRVLLEEHPADGDQDSPETLVKLAHDHSAVEAVAILQAHIADKAIDGIVNRAFGMRASGPPAATPS